LHCGNSTCQGSNTITVADLTVTTGWDTSLALDSNGNPVVSYEDGNSKKLKVLHCGTATCQ
jgi:hypothetical protein